MTRRLWLIWGLSLFIKFILSCLIPLSFDESYYWVWSHHLRLSYFDHPPAIAVLLWLGHLFDGLGSGVRMPTVLLGHFCFIIWIKILDRFNFDERQKIFWLCLSLVSPLIGWGSLIATPDVPLLFFWSASCLFFLNCVERRSLIDYALLGASLGLGFCSKYHIVLFVPAAFLVIGYLRVWKNLKVSNVLATIGFGLVFSSPVIIWNYLNDFQSFKFQLTHGFGRTDWTIMWSVTYVFGQTLILFPTAVYSLIKNLKGSPVLLVSFGLFPLVFFFISSFKGLVEANWPAVAYPCLIAISCRETSLKRVKIAIGSLFVLGSIASALAIFNWKQLGPRKLTEVRETDVLLASARELSPMYYGTYQVAARLWYVSKTPHYKLYGMSRFDFFDQIQSGPPAENQFYVTRELGADLPKWLVEPKFKTRVIKTINETYDVVEVQRQ